MRKSGVCSTILYILKFSRDFSFANFLFQNYLRCFEFANSSLYGLNELIISEKLELARHRIRNTREN